MTIKFVWGGSISGGRSNTTRLGEKAQATGRYGARLRPLEPLSRFNERRARDYWNYPPYLYTNGFVASGILVSYKLLVWTCQINRNKGSVLFRGWHWHRCSRMAAADGVDYRIFSAEYMMTNRLYGIGLYNPTTGARSLMKVVEYRGANGDVPDFGVLK